MNYPTGLTASDNYWAARFRLRNARREGNQRDILAFSKQVADRRKLLPAHELESVHAGELREKWRTWK